MKQVILLLMVISLVLLSGCTTQEPTGNTVLLDNNTRYREVALQEEIKILKQQISDLEEEKGALQKKVENMTLSVSKEEVVTEIPLSEEEQGVDFTIKSINAYEEEGKLYVQVIISHPVRYTSRSPLNIYTHPNKNVNEPFEFDNNLQVQLSLRKKDGFDLVWIDDITYYTDKYKQLKIESFGIEFCDPDLDVCEFVIKEYNGTIDLE